MTESTGWMGSTSIVLLAAGGGSFIILSLWMKTIGIFGKPRESMNSAWKTAIDSFLGLSLLILGAGVVLFLLHQLFAILGIVLLMISHI